jgi:NADH dehydrogenase FAD-containing subunit
MAENTEVVVVGGGYAGVLAANRLTGRDDVHVTLINPRPSFVERLRLHQLVGGSHDPVVDYRDVLADRVRLVVDAAARIDAAGRTVLLGSGDAIGYDYLVYAVGSGSVDLSHVPGAAEHALPIADLEAALALRQAIDAASADAAVTVVGSGATGIETAAELAEQGRAVTLVCGRELGPYLHPRVRPRFARRLAALGVTVLEGPGATVTAVTRDAVRLADGRELPSAVTVWAAGFGVPALAAASGLATDDAGRLLTDETLTSVDDDRIVAAGDAAAPSGMPFRMSCAAARPLGAHAADTVLRRIAGEAPENVDVGLFFQCVSLGRGAALVQLASRSDVANRYWIGGRFAVWIKETACTKLTEELAKEARKPGSFSWPFTDGTRPRRLREAHRGAGVPGRAV